MSVVNLARAGRRSLHVAESVNVNLININFQKFIDINIKGQGLKLEVPQSAIIFKLKGQIAAQKLIREFYKDQLRSSKRKLQQAQLNNKEKEERYQQLLKAMAQLQKNYTRLDEQFKFAKNQGTANSQYFERKRSLMESIFCYHPFPFFFFPTIFMCMGMKQSSFFDFMVFFYPPIQFAWSLFQASYEVKRVQRQKEKEKGADFQKWSYFYGYNRPIRKYKWSLENQDSSNSPFFQ